VPNESTHAGKEVESVCPMCATAPTLKLRTTAARALCFCLRCGRTFEFQLDLPPADEA
jgi:hypothetical protein